MVDFKSKTGSKFGITDYLGKIMGRGTEATKKKKMFGPYLCHDEHLEHHSFFKAI